MATKLELANRTMQHVGATRLVSLTQTSKSAAEFAACYDTIRRAELRRNVWRCSIRRASIRPFTDTTMRVVAPTYSATQVYPALALVISDGQVFISLQDGNVGNTPDTSIAVYWTLYYGVLYADVYDSGVAYNASEFVYTPAADNTYNVFMSLTNTNDEAPSTTAPAYDATVTYNRGAFVVSSSILYESLVDLNINHTPVSSTTEWLAFAAYAGGTTYAAGDKVTDGSLLYVSLVGTNIGHTPASSPTYWRIYQVNRANGAWLWLDDTTVSRIINPANLYPSMSVYPLPNGFLREAAQDPKAGSVSVYGAPSNAAYKDWLFEGDYIITRDFQVQLFRFVADLGNVAAFDPMLFEGLAARVASEVCEALTQSNTKQAAIEAKYDKVMGDARLVNGIEVGSEEPPLDDYIATRG